MKTITRIPVRGYHIDHFGHVNNARYQEFMEEGRWQYCEENGLIDNLFHKLGLIHVVKEIKIRYRRPAKAGHILRIRTGVEKVAGKDIHMYQEIFLDGTETRIADASVANTLFDPLKKTSVEITPDIAAVWRDLGNQG